MFKRAIKKVLPVPLRFLYYTFNMYDAILSRIHHGYLGWGRELLIKQIDNDIKVTKHGSVRFLMYTPNFACDIRHSTFSAKEPEILEWIEEYGGGVFFDVGANIGIYSLFYAQLKSGNVYCFEPSVFNLRQLAKNVSINHLSERIVIISNPLTDATGIAKFINGSDKEGGSLSAFGVEFGHDGNPIAKNIGYQILGFSLDDLFDKNILREKPSLIKIDVDGIEHLILKGASRALRDKTLKSIFIEVNDNFTEQSEQVKTSLESAGFRLKEKRRAVAEVRNEKFRGVYNQIWVRC